MNALADMLARLAAAVTSYAEAQLANNLHRAAFAQRRDSNTADGISSSLMQPLAESRRSSVRDTLGRTPGAASLQSGGNMSFGADPLHFPSERRASNAQRRPSNAASLLSSPGMESAAGVDSTSSERILSAGSHRTAGVTPLRDNWSIDAVAPPLAEPSPTTSSVVPHRSSTKNLRNKQLGSVADIVGVLRATRTSGAASPSGSSSKSLSLPSENSLSSPAVVSTEAVGKFVTALRDVTRSGRTKRSTGGGGPGADVSGLVVGGVL